MTARPSHAGVSETARMKTNSTRNSLENTDAASADSADPHDARVFDAPDPQPAGTPSVTAAATTGGNASLRPNRSSFQITRIVQAETPDDAGPSLEGARNADAAFDSARVTDTARDPGAVEESGLQPSCQNHPFPNPSHLVRTRPSDINSRFKIVKIESNKPLRRGRWICFEFGDPPHLSIPQEKVVKCNNDAGSTGSAIPSPIYYIQVEKEDPSKNRFAAIVYSDGQPSLDPNPLPFSGSGLSPGSCSIAPESLVPPVSIPRSDRRVGSSKETSSLSFEANGLESERSKPRNRHPIPLRDDGRGAMVNGVSGAGDDAIRRGDGDQDVTVIRAGSDPSFVYSKVSGDMASTLFTIVPSSTTVYANGFGENDISEGVCALDNKIEQAMDLVKSHLMFAVHEEVELLKDQIKELMMKKDQLEYENHVLRASATQETLEKLDQPGSSSSSSTSVS